MVVLRLAVVQGPLRAESQHAIAGKTPVVDHAPLPQATRVPKVEKFKYLVPGKAVAVINSLRLAGPSDLLPFASQH